MTEEEIKEYNKRLEEQSDLKAALASLGSKEASILDIMVCKTLEDFKQYGEILGNKPSIMKKQKGYVELVKTAIKNLCSEMNSIDLSTIVNEVTALKNERLTQEKNADKKGKKKKTNTKTTGPKVTKATNNDFGYDDYYDDAYEDEYDDFM